MGQMTPLRRARLQRGLSQREVAETVGMDPANLSRIENRKQQPTVEQAEKLARLLRIGELQILYPERYMRRRKRAA